MGRILEHCSKVEKHNWCKPTGGMRGTITYQDTLVRRILTFYIFYGEGHFTTVCSSVTPVLSTYKMNPMASTTNSTQILTFPNSIVICKSVVRVVSHVTNLNPDWLFWKKVSMI